MSPQCQCPSVDELARLLVEPDVDLAESDIVEHVGECSGCQMRLEKLADSDSQIVQLVEHIDQALPNRESAYWPAMQAVQEFADSADTPTYVPRTTPRAPSKSDDSLDFLEPSDDPAYLGRLGHFEIARLIGRGGMGLVFEAYDPCLQRSVAIKVLDPTLANDEVSMQRFCREARAAASITHDNVVSVYQVEETEDGKIPFLVMQLIQGETLEQRLRRDGQLPVQDIIRISLQASAALAAAHSQGVIHRDIKPGNILLDSSSGRAKLTDFGLARCIEDLGITRTGFVAGTPLYMSPEQALGEKLDERSDLFSLGAVLYEMSTGQPPFHGNSPLAVLKQITDRSAPPVRSLNPNSPAWLNELIQKLLAKRPDERPISASVVAEELARRLSAFEPISPVQITPVHTSGACETVMRQHRRNRTTSMIVGMVVGAVAMLAIAIPFLSRPGSNPPAATSDGPVPIATLAANAGPIWSLALTPDGHRLAMGIEDGTIKFWNVDQRQVESTINAHEGPTVAVAISFDGAQAATGHDDGTVHVWDMATEKSVRELKADGPVGTLAFAPASHELAVGTRTGQLAIWNSDSGEMTTSFEGHKGVVSDVAFSHDGNSLASAGGDKTARLWNVKSGRERTELKGQTGAVYAIAFSPDDQRIATGGWDKAVRLWETSTGNPTGVLEGHKSDVWSVAFSPDGKLLASTGEDHDVHLWNTADLRPIATLAGHTGAVYAEAFTKDGDLISAGRDGTAKIWDARKLESAR
jgi:serine/threonine protein kinase